MTVFDSFRLDGKRALICGGSRGLGRAMAKALAEAGADLLLTGRDAAALETAAEELRGLGREVWCLSGDMGDPEDAERLCQAALALGPVDILINNVGGRRLGDPVTAQSTEDFRRLMDLNLTSTFVAIRTIGAAMVARGQGRIINTASISAFAVLKGTGGRHYEAAKAAVVQLTRAVAVDFAATGVTVNAICPGIFMTEPNQRWAREKPEMMEKLLEAIPMGRAGEPDEIGPLALYLASDASRYMTGAVLVLDGGRSI